MRARNFSGLVFAVAALQLFPTGLLQAQESMDFPAALLCSANGRTGVAYLSVIEADGVARYTSFSGAGAIVDANGVVRPASTMNPGDCAGRSITELRQAGKTKEFARQ